MSRKVDDIESLCAYHSLIRIVLEYVVLGHTEIIEKFRADTHPTLEARFIEVGDQAATVG